ncbi:MAG: C_GCAxxG_C_C family protein [Desulfobacterales bacterium]|nr:MAG: C_GCAxxG_C_C family protein [Desulfobacterales bacterium]
MERRSQAGASPTSEELIALIRRRAENLFGTQQLYCSEAVLYVLNQGLRGGLPPAMAVRLASGFTDGIGGAGCVCGAVSGGLMALGLFLGRDGLNAQSSKRVRAKSKEIHDAFRTRFGSACCRILTKRVRNDHKAMMEQCTHRTGETVEIVARLILEARPDLLHQADWDFLAAQDSKIRARFKRLLSVVIGISTK